MRRVTMGAVAAAMAMAGCGGGGSSGNGATGFDPVARFASKGAGKDGKAIDPNRPVTLRILEPAPDQVLQTNDVTVRFAIENYDLDQDPATKAGNHIHFILDNEPYVPHYDEQPFTFRDVAPGTHVIRAFPSRPWHESWKNPGAFAMVRFDVLKPSGAVPLDASKPILTYSRPKGAYKGADGEHILLDFWLLNCDLSGGGLQVRYALDGQEQPPLTEWRPVWLNGLAKGSHTIKLELLDRDGKLVENGWNRTERTITVE